MRASRETGGNVNHFFVSYNKADRAWAEWIAWELEAAGYSVVIQAWDFRPGSNFILDMQQAATQAERTLALLSPDYLEARYTQPEWAAAFAQDPTGEKGMLVPVRVRECELTGMFRGRSYIDLVAFDETAAKKALVAGIKQGRAKPDTKPAFPQTAGQTVAPRPKFPGVLVEEDSKSTFSVLSLIKSKYGVALIIVIASLVIALTTQNGAELGGRVVRVTLSSGAIPLNSTNLRNLERARGILTKAASSDLTRAGSDTLDHTGWSLAQVTVAVVGTGSKIDKTDRQRILSAFDKSSVSSCGCWRELNSSTAPGFPPNLVATGWVITAKALLTSPASEKTLQFFSSTQHSDGWWSVFPTKQKNAASIYGTCWSILGLQTQLEKNLVSTANSSDVVASISRGVSWLLKVRKDTARWQSYPYEQREVSVSLSGLALHTLHRVGGLAALTQIDREWLDHLPDEPPPAMEVESQNFWIETTKGHAVDHFQQIKLPWLIVATVDAFPNGTTLQQAHALMWLERAVSHDSVLNADTIPDNWWQAELLYALNYLYSKVSNKSGVAM
jgi:hypothetical protein